MTLRDIAPGKKCRIEALLGRGATYQRLLEMGMIAGTELEVLRYAPLGDPLEIRIHGYHLSLRKAEAQLVEVAYV